MTYRNLSQDEITALEGRNCTCRDWSQVQVSDPFDAGRIKNVDFYGSVQLGVFSEDVNRPGGIVLPSGISNSRIHNCTIGDQVYIANAQHIANYAIGDRVFIENTASLIVDGESSFGNGVEIDVLNEGGGRELKLYDRLSSQIAYLMVLYRYDKELIAKLDALISDYVKSRTSSTGVIGEGSVITGCKEITNVDIGPCAVLSGANCLENGTIASTQADPTTIGSGVFAKDFIVQSGSKVDSGAILASSFVGQGVKVEKQFSAENSVFFANSEAMHGEGCSVFAGPFTVSHHKSSLLIAGLLSFYNAGSGTNSSNHMYKLGPVHQGILERGTKTGSFSYLLQPCHIAPFSVVLGKHYAHFDISDFPFSYIMEAEGKSVVLPGRNLVTVGVRRDSMKWPNRDRRKDPVTFDLIHYDLFNPFIVGKMVGGLEILNDLAAKTEEGKPYIAYKGALLPASKLKSSGKFYEMGIDIFIGDCLIGQLENQGGKSFDQIKKAIAPGGDLEMSGWRDLCGLLASDVCVEMTLASIKDGSVKDVNGLHSELKSLFERYDDEKWAWCCGLIEKQYGKKFSELTKDDFTTIVTAWKERRTELNDQVAKDATKEFGAESQIGFGLDGGDGEKQADFDAVRGTAETNSVIQGLKDENTETEKRAKKILALIG